MPALVVRLLFASALEGTGVIVARIAGIELVCMALACGVGARIGEPGAILVGMVAYNLLVGAYLVFVGLEVSTVAPLLWPVAIVHFVFAAFLVGASRHQASENRR
jgi:hypothetical protein